MQARVRGLRAMRIVAATVIGGAALLVAAGSTPAGADTTAGPYDLAMGASLVTGVGSTTGEDYVDDLYAYAQPLVPGLQLDNLGCSGETTATMINGGHCHKYVTGSQLGDAEQIIEDNPGQVAFVTLDIGADDVLGCAPGGVIDQTCFETGLAQVEADISQIVAGLRSASSTVPIVGMTYYDPYLADWLEGPSGQSEAKQSVKLLKQLNGVLTAAYAADDVTIASAFKTFDTTDFADQSSWDGQTVPLNVANICSWTYMCTGSGPTIHCNDDGYAQLADAFEKALVVPPTLAGTPTSGTVGQPYSFAFTVGGIPAAKVRHTGKLPKGMTLSRQGVLSGVPRQAGTYSFTVSVTNKGGTVAAPESLTVSASS